MLGRFWGSYTSPRYIGNWMIDKFPHRGITGSNFIMVDGHVGYLNFNKTLENGSVSDTRETLWDAHK